MFANTLMYTVMYNILFPILALATRMPHEGYMLSIENNMYKNYV